MKSKQDLQLPEEVMSLCQQCFGHKKYIRCGNRTKPKGWHDHFLRQLYFILSLPLKVKYINMVTRFELVLLQHLQQLLHRGITGQQLALLLHGRVGLAEIFVLCFCAGVNLRKEGGVFSIIVLGISEGTMKASLHITHIQISVSEDF